MSVGGVLAFGLLHAHIKRSIYGSVRGHHTSRIANLPLSECIYISGSHTSGELSLSPSPSPFGSFVFPLPSRP